MCLARYTPPWLQPGTTLGDVNVQLAAFVPPFNLAGVTVQVWHLMPAVLTNCAWPLFLSLAYYRAPHTHAHTHAHTSTLTHTYSHSYTHIAHLPPRTRALLGVACSIIPSLV